MFVLYHLLQLPALSPATSRIARRSGSKQTGFAVPTARSIPAAAPSCSYAVNEPLCRPMDDQVEVRARREALMQQQSAHTSLGQDLTATAPRVLRQHSTSYPSYNSRVIQLKCYIAGHLLDVQEGRAVTPMTVVARQCVAEKKTWQGDDVVLFEARTQASSRCFSSPASWLITKSRPALISCLCR
jgi:hypothetical protein